MTEEKRLEDIIIEKKDTENNNLNDEILGHVNGGNNTVVALPSLAQAVVVKTTKTSY